jgi:hypothetical protein
MAYKLISGGTPADAPRWASYGLSDRAFVTLRGYRGTMPLYVRLPPLVAPGDYRLRVELVHGDLDIGDVRARTATLYSPLRVIPPTGGDG